MERGAGAITRLEVADGFFPRLLGLCGFAEVDRGYALAFPRCRAIHTMWMRCAIDVIYLDEGGIVLGVETLSPWKLGHAPKGTVETWEMSEGECEKLGIAPKDDIRTHVAESIVAKRAGFRAKPHVPMPAKQAFN